MCVNKGHGSTPVKLSVLETVFLHANGAIRNTNCHCKCDGCVSSSCLGGTVTARAHGDVLRMRTTLDKDLRDWGLNPSRLRDMQEYDPRYYRGMGG